MCLPAKRTGNDRRDGKSSFFSEESDEGCVNVSIFSVLRKYELPTPPIMGNNEFALSKFDAFKDWPLYFKF